MDILIEFLSKYGIEITDKKINCICKNTNVPEIIGNFENISIFNCSVNERFHLRFLKNLTLVNCGITKFDHDLPNLKRLNLSKNKLKTIDINCNILIISHNELESVSGKFHKLVCDHNNLETVPEAKYLDCSFNKIKKLDIKCGTLIANNNQIEECSTDAKIVNLSNNKLTEFDILGKVADLSNNALTKISLTDCEFLNLENNNIDLLHLKTHYLVCINLLNNPCSDVILDCKYLNYCKRDKEIEIKSLLLKDEVIPTPRTGRGFH